jgi:DNA-binding beta-propeller fold protein YncE
MRTGGITTWVLAIVVAAVAHVPLVAQEEGPILRPDPKPRPAVSPQHTQQKTVVAPTIVTRIGVPANAAAALAINPALNKIYVSGGASAGQQVVEIAGMTGTLTVLGAGSGASVDMATNRVWAAGVYDGSVLVYDGGNRELIRTVHLGACPVGTSYDPVNGRAWVGAQCGGGNDPTYAVSGSSYQVESDPAGSGGTYNGNPIANPRTGTAYLGSSRGNGPPTSLRIDPQSGFLQTTNSFGEVGAVDPVKNLLFAVPAQDATQLQIVSGGPGPETVVRTATLPFTASFGSLAVNPVLSHLYVGDSADNSIAVLDETSGITLATIALGSGNTPGPLAVDPVRNLLYALVSSANGTQLYVLQDGGN